MQLARGRTSMMRATVSIQGWQPSAHPGPGKLMILLEGGHVMPRITGAKFMVQMMQAYGSLIRML